MQLKNSTKQKRRQGGSKAGQTLVEFAMVSILFVFMLVLTVNSILAFSVQQYISYAVFMSARAYQAAGDVPLDQKLNARKVLQEFIPGLPNVESMSGLGHPLKFINSPKTLAYITQVIIPDAKLGDYGPAGLTSPLAIRVSYRVPLVELPIGRELRARFGLIDLSSQSFLGREASHLECREFFKGFLGKFKLQGPAAQKNQNFSEQNHYYMEDNGC